jgi:hypothetical protein
MDRGRNGYRTDSGQPTQRSDKYADRARPRSRTRRKLSLLLVRKILTTVLMREESRDIAVGESHCLQNVPNFVRFFS